MTYNNQRTNNINNITNNLVPVTDRKFMDHLDDLDMSYILDGPEGYAQYALDYPFKNSLLCVDYPRKKVIYKNEHGDVETDHEMTKICQKFFGAIEFCNSEII